MKTYTSETQQHNLHIPLVERLKVIPETFGIRLNEEPHYRVLMKDGNFEIRLYSKQLVAKVTLSGLDFNEFRETAFKKLAGYIFEGNSESKAIPMTSPVLEQHGFGQRIAMTSPVYQEESDEASTWTMSFILPEEYTMDNAPTPLNDEVRLEEIPQYQVASLTYSGNNSLEKVKEHERELAEWLNIQTHIQSVGKYMIAQYDAPFVIPFMKRNEIQVRVKSVH